MAITIWREGVSEELAVQFPAEPEPEPAPSA
jgi:hypothetical protein